MEEMSLPTLIVMWAVALVYAGAGTVFVLLCLAVVGSWVWSQLPKRRGHR